MKKYLSLVLFGVILSGNSFAKDEPSLLLEGGLSTIIAYKDDFIIEYKDQVSDGCLPYPSKMRDKLELGLRQNGMAIGEKGNELFSPTITITALGYALANGSCAVSMSIEMTFWALVQVPYALNEDDNHTMAVMSYPLANQLLTGPKDNMQSRIEKIARDVGDNLYLDLSRAKDNLKRDFPKIAENYQKSIKVK